MATYAELYNLATDSNLRNKVAVANHIIALDIVEEDAGTANHAQRLKWATYVLADPDGWGQKMLRAVIADNEGLTTAQITGASDAAIKTSCNKLIDAFAVNL